MPDIRIVGGDQNNPPIVAAHVRAFERANALAVVQVNASGDIVNPGGGSSGGDGAINDGVSSSIKATVKSNATSQPTSSDSSLVVSFAVGITREMGKVTVREITSGVAISGDVSTVPKAGETWPVSVAGTVNVTGSTSANPVGVSGDVTTVPKAGQVWPTRQQDVVGVQIVGGAVGGKVGVSGDVNVTATDLDIRNLNPAQDSVRIHGGVIGVTGDRSITDGVDVSIKATVKDYANSNPVAVVLTNVSGDAYNGAHVRQTPSAVYKNVNITTAATLIWASNSSRIAAYVQNVERQQMFLGFDDALTVVNAGIILAPTTNHSGDGGNFSIDQYTGSIYGILASGDADVRAVEI